LGGRGGRVGPDLSSLNARLQTEFVHRIISDPQGLMSETVMPKVEMPPATLDLIVNYLMQQEEPRDSTSYPSLADHRPYFHQGLERRRGLYTRYCAACHGVTGEGDGYNAEFLPTTPTRHADAAYMATRPDDTLFDGIYAGGYILNKSHYMPPWGFSLERDDIRELVAYLRELCDCDGPPWSRR
jgi:mono/diheme cytochrome c family protein